MLNNLKEWAFRLTSIIKTALKVFLKTYISLGLSTVLKHCLFVVVLMIALCLHLRLPLFSSCLTLSTRQIQILPVQIAVPAGLNEIKPFCSHVITPKSGNSVEVNLCK